MTDKWGNLTEREKADMHCYWRGMSVWREDIKDGNYPFKVGNDGD